MKEEQPHVMFGIVTDIQYANCDDCMSYDGLRKRYYRNSVTLLQNAVANWEQLPLKFILQLGDLVDGKAHLINDSHDSMNKVLNIFNKNVLHVWGNHEMYNFKRSELINTPLNTARVLNYERRSANANYYLYEVSEGLNLICLDLYELAVIGYDESDLVYAEALQLIKAHNPNTNLNDGTDCTDEDSKYVAYNGAPTQTQLDWLREMLEMSKTQSKKVIIAGHIPLRPESSSYKTLPFNADQILEVIYAYKEVCVAYFGGHYHEGGSFKDEYNILHITFPAILEAPPDMNAYSTVKVFEKKILIDIVYLTNETFEIDI